MLRKVLDCEILIKRIREIKAKTLSKALWITSIDTPMEEETSTFYRKVDVSLNAKG